MEDLNFKSVGRPGSADVPEVTGKLFEFTDEASILAVILYHNELPPTETGSKPYTLRYLMTKFCYRLWSNPLFVEYICAFGAHGEAVIRRVVNRNADEAGLKAFEEDVQSKLALIQRTLKEEEALAREE